MKFIHRAAASALTAMIALTAATSCSDTKSYAERLTEENQAVNVFLSDQRVADYFPDDGSYEIGPDAPYYRMDEEGNVYMQVLDKGNSARPATDNRVYFRFTRYPLSRYENGELGNGAGNSDDISGANGMGSTYFLFDNFKLQASIKYGSGIQVPMKYLGSDAKVNLVVKSQFGWYDETSNVVPFLYHIRYYESPMFPWTGGEATAGE